MPSIYELDTERDSLIANESGSDASDALLDESVSFTRPRSRLDYAKRNIPSVWRTTGWITLVVVVVVFVLALKPTRRKPYEKLPDSSNPDIEHLPSEYFSSYDSQRVRIRYGPYSVPPSSTDNGMRNFINQDATMPCHDCLITWMQADLVYADGEDGAGSSANADTGMWLHHTVLTNAASADVKGCRYDGERFFASGNERTVVDLTLNGTEKVGYYLPTTSTVWMMTELMNAHPTSARDVILTITYEYIPSSGSASSALSSTQPSVADFAHATSIWLDIGGCEDSEVPVPSDETKFQFVSPAWESTIGGRILCVLGHLHDGGVELDVSKGGDSVCRSVPRYGGGGGGGVGEENEGDDGHDGHERRHGHGDMDMSHITQMSLCHDVGRIEIGEKWTVQADYDIAAHPPMLDATNEPEPIMGIAVMYILED